MLRSPADEARLPVTAIKGVGDQLAARLLRLGIRTVQDVLFHLPLRYQDRTHVTPIGSARIGQDVVVVGRIEHVALAYGRRRSLLTRISDGTGALTIRLFHFSAAQQQGLSRGRWIRCFGEVRAGPSTVEMIHPEYRVTDEPPSVEAEAGLTPIYPATEGVRQATLRGVVQRAMRSHLLNVPELLPDAVLERLGYPTLHESLSYLHAPPAGADQQRLAAGSDPAQQRLAFEELLAHHLSLRKLRQRRQTLRAPAMIPRDDRVAAFWSCLGFTPTGAQRRVCAEVLEDLSRPVPMLRLVQGDVGSGKTVVAAAAAVRSAENGYQTAVMAPTELLAEQHYRTLRQWLEGLGIRVAWLSGRVVGRERQSTLTRLRRGEDDIVVGTHALFQSDIEFARLGLAVVDEQHRFGVDQRLALRDKGRSEVEVPHQLIVTATPIPRTLAMTFYADLDVSNLDELPPGRRPVETVAIPDTRRAEVVERVRRACAAGRQAYWVCPLIDESELLQAQAATETEAALVQAAPELRVGLVHGRMKAAEKDRIMERFRRGHINVLVATTVIEVGVDVPTASLMIIENAERLGLSQLHQLRGRVGRGSERSACVLMFHPPLSEHARIRLDALRRTTDGFEIARRDLELRGPGEVLGTRQTGIMRMRVADLARDRGLLPQVQSAGAMLMARNMPCVDQLINRWIGEGEEYGVV